jgi:hypothetical protein
VKAGGQDVFVYEFPNPEFPEIPLHVAYFDFDGVADVEVSRLDGVPLKSAAARPLRAGVKASLEGNRMRFKLERPENLSVELDGDVLTSLMLFSNPPEAEKPKEGTPGLIFLGPGIHDFSTKPKLALKDGESLYVAGGALVKGLVISYSGTRGAKIYGRGILASNVMTLDLPPGFKKRPSAIYFNSGSGLEIDDVILVRNMPGWCNTNQNARNLVIRGMRTVSHSPCGDGIDLVNCQNVLLDGVFIRSNDDTVCLKVYDLDPNAKGYLQGYRPGGGSGGIVVRNSTLFNANWGSSTEIGAETVGGSLSEVLFENIDVIHSLGSGSPNQYGSVFGILLCGDTKVSKIRYENVRIEDVKPDDGLIDMRICKKNWSMGRPRGTISDISFKNIRYLGDGDPKAILLGADEEHRISNVSVDGLFIRDREVKGLESGDFMIPAYVENLRFAAAPGVAWSSQPGWKIKSSYNDKDLLFAVDASPSTFWASETIKAEERAWVALNLSSGPKYKGGPVAFDNVRFLTFNQASCPLDYELYATDDFQNWGAPIPFEKKLEQKENGKRLLVSFSFAPQSKKHLVLAASKFEREPLSGAPKKPWYQYANKEEQEKAKAEASLPPPHWNVFEFEAFDGDSKIDLSFPPVQAKVK